ncbi:MULTISPECIES: hypothetical protein [Roseomonadaceae]|uniref:Uncharacterized protein n=1 Tax=Falsiroseomonas oleicola TaxID=2801474 RepID=A0ABS6HB66_9PROT|nr:hypothetical protein [Roseomonas oleicola]MBU8544555.1 hypothetical protein [Roseomonas oleicola]
MNPINRIANALFAAGALSFAVPALANDVTYPRVVGTGENASVEYGPAATQNIVGGGAVTIATGHDGAWRVTHTDPSFAQRAPAGLVPVTVGSGESQRTAWVPAAESLRLLAQAGGPTGG